jgi:hypothetical protein
MSGFYAGRKLRVKGVLWEIVMSVLRAVPWWFWLVVFGLPALKKLIPMIRKKVL